VAVTFMCGFEAAAALVDGIVLSTNAAYSTTQARTGTRSIRVNPGSGAQGTANIATPGQGWFHFALYITTLPSVSRQIVHSSTTGQAALMLSSTGTLQCWVNNTNIGSSSALSTGRWYWIGLRDKTSASDVEWLQVDGVGQNCLATATITTTIGWFGCGGTEASAIDIYFDDVIGDDAGFLAPSNVALLLPISDNARATLWTGGSGGTTNLYDAVNNCPPVGSATESNTTQIEHAGGAVSSTDAYDANLTTYTTAGVGSGDTVLAAQALIVWGEDISTGTKLLSYRIDSNPLVFGELSIDVSTGHGSGAVGTYSTGADYWNERRSAIKTTGLVIGTDITLGTSPVFHVVRPETASRVASVCFTGMYVAWTPYVAPPASGPPIQPKVYPQILVQ